MSEQPLKRAQEAIEEGRKAADEAPIMPFGDSPLGETPEDTGGAVAEHGDDETDDAGGRSGDHSGDRDDSGQSGADETADRA